MIKKSIIFIPIITCLNHLGISQMYNGNTIEESAKNVMNSQIGMNSKNMNYFKIPYTKTTHIVFPEPILFVDISSPFVEGDLPEKNIFRLRPNATVAENGHSIGIDEILR